MYSTDGAAAGLFTELEALGAHVEQERAFQIMVYYPKDIEPDKLEKIKEVMAEYKKVSLDNISYSEF